MLERLSAECAPPSAASSSESALAEVIDEIAARLQRGEPVDVEPYLADHPQWAEPLKKLLPALEALAVAGQASGTRECAGSVERRQASGLRRQEDEDSDSESSATAVSGPPASSRRVPACGWLATSQREQDSNPKSKIENRKCLGDFELVREIGRGGMGVVYEATQMSLSRRVAVKVLPQAGMLDSRQLQRFQNEARAAAQLNHPHIVDVICVGFDDGVHFFAMRFVDGQTLAEVIREGSGLGVQGSGKGSQESEVRSQEGSSSDGNAEGSATALTPARLCRERTPWRSVARRGIVKRKTAERHGTREARVPGSLQNNDDASIQNPKSKIQNCAAWLAEAAEALDHAHSVGVVHRDIKPSNLLVDRAGKLWITDFGLARVGDEAGLTMTGDLLGTLRYMSPEQAIGQRAAIDHRSDIYGLGATMYELLTLRPVFDGVDRSELLRQIAFADPRPLRKLDPRIPRDLETIALKALEKSPADRYTTAGEMAADLRRHLRGEPIRARQLSGRQQIVRWTQRHVGLVYSIGAVLIICLVMSMIAGFAVYQSNREKDEALGVAEQQRSLAEERLNIAKQAVDDYLNRVTEDPGLKRSDFMSLRKSLLESAVPFYERLADQKPGDASGDAERGRAYHRLALLREAVGERDEAAADFQQARTTFSRLAAEAPSVPAYRADLAAVEFNLGSLLAVLGQVRESEQALRHSVLLREELVADSPDVPEYRRDLAFSYNGLGKFMNALGRQDDCESFFRAALLLRQKLADEFPNVLEYLLRLGSSHNNFGNLLRTTGRLEQAEESYRAALSVEQKLAGKLPQLDPYRVSVSNWHNSLAELLSDLGRYTEAETAYRDALDIQEQLVAHFPTVPEYRETEARSHYNLGVLFARIGQYDNALSAFKAYLTIEEKLAAGSPNVPGYSQGVAMCQHSLGQLFSELGEHSDAATAYRTAIMMQQKLVADFPVGTAYPLELAVSHRSLGALMRELDKTTEADAEIRAALGIEQDVAGAFPDTPEFRKELAITQWELGNLLCEQGWYDEAEAAHRSALATQEKLVRDHPTVPEYRQQLAATRNSLAVLLAQTGHRDEALAACRAALEIREKLAADFPEVPRYAIDLGESYYQLGELLRDSNPSSEALEWYDKSIDQLEGVLAKENRLVKARRLLSDAYKGRSHVLNELIPQIEAVDD